MTFNHATLDPLNQADCLMYADLLETEVLPLVLRTAEEHYGEPYGETNYFYADKVTHTIDSLRNYGSDPDIFAMESIMDSNLTRKLRKRKHRRVNAMHKTTDRRHGKSRQLTRKQELSANYYWHQVGDSVLVAYRGRNKKKDYIPEEYRV